MSIKESEIIKIDLLVPSESNPNEMTEKQLTKLCEQILKYEFTEPLMVVRRPDKKYDIVSGHHRHKAAMQLGYAELPCYVYSDWTEAEKEIAMIRMNVVKGKMNPMKFMDLFDRHAMEYGEEIVEDMMGFADTDALDEIKKQIKSSLPPAIAKKVEEMEKKHESTSVEELTKVVADIMTEYGETVPSNFVHFTHGGKDHVMQRTDDALWGELRKMYQAIEAQGLDAIQVFKILFDGWEEVVLRRNKKKKKVEEVDA